MRGVNLNQGEAFTLAALAAREATAGTNGTAYVLQGERVAIGLLCKFTAKATDASDTCDVYVDVLVDGTNWVNAVHFTQALGNGTDAASEYALLLPSANTAPLVITTVTADAASGVVRPDIIGSQIRARWVIVNSSTDDESFTFSVTGYAY